MSQMNKGRFLLLFVLSFALVPVVLAVSQDVPTQSTYQETVLLVSLAAFGLALGQFWLSRLLPRVETGVSLPGLIRRHKYIGATIGGFLLVHPFLIIARRLWVLQSDPIENLLLMLCAPALLPAIIAWGLLATIIVLALVRRWFPSRVWRILHGLLSSGFVGLAAWHVAAVGRHGDRVVAALLIALVAGSIATLLFSYRTMFRKPLPAVREEVR
jgi:predicted ferric reductase